MTAQDQIYNDLHKKYNKQTLTKKETALELSLGLSTITKYIRDGVGLPNYLRIGESKNARVMFNLRDISEFLANTTKTV